MFANSFLTKPAIRVAGSETCDTADFEACGTVHGLDARLQNRGNLPESAQRTVNIPRIQSLGIRHQHKKRELRELRRIISKGNRCQPLHFRVALGGVLIVRQITRKDILMKRETAEFHSPTNRRRPAPVGKGFLLLLPDPIETP